MGHCVTIQEENRVGQFAQAAMQMTSDAGYGWGNGRCHQRSWSSPPLFDGAVRQVVEEFAVSSDAFGRQTEAGRWEKNDRK